MVPLTAPADADPGASSGCATIPADLASALAKNPSKYYFNLHSMPKFPGGAVRGELSWRQH